MRLLRGLAGALLWILAGVLALVSLLLCVTILLLPLGIPLFRLSKALFGKSVRLMLPAGVAHPVKETRKKGQKAKPEVPEAVGKAGKKLRKATGKKGRKLRRKGKKARKKARNKAREATGRRRKLFG